MVDISTVEIGSVPKRSALAESRRDLSEDRIGRLWQPLGCRVMELGKPTQGGVMYCTLYTVGARVLPESIPYD